MAAADKLEIAPVHSPDWRDEAACRGELKLFFAKKAERPQARARREAKAVRLCESCPVQQPCKAFAREHREYGFWAGESEEDRHLLGFTVSAPIGIRARLAKQDSMTPQDQAATPDDPMATQNDSVAS